MDKKDRQNGKDKRVRKTDINNRADRIVKQTRLASRTVRKGMTDTLNRTEVTD